MGGKAQKGRAIVLGRLFHQGDAVTAFTTLHYALALRRLGYEVFYLEPQSEGSPSEHDETIIPLLQTHGFGEHWSRYDPRGNGTCAGLGSGPLESLRCEADFLLSLAPVPLCDSLATPRRIYIRHEPFLPPSASAPGNDTPQGLADYDTLFHVGTGVAQEHGRVWLPTLPPVLLDLWPVLPAAPGAPYLTLAEPSMPGLGWGETWGWLGDRGLEKLLLVPTLRKGPFELVADLDQKIAGQFTARGWRVSMPNAQRRDAGTYRRLVQNARALYLGAAQHSVHSATGWMSGTAAWCLASGRPVIAQETGFADVLPTGKGLFAFTNAREVLAAIDAIENDYARQSRAARDLAAEHFEGERVVSQVLRQAGIEV